MISIENLEKELKTGKLNSIYFLYGEELFLLENTLKKIKNIFGECIKGINYINIDETNYNQLISDIETPAFGYEKKLIIARNTGLLKKEGKRKNAELAKVRDKITNYLQENFNMIKESVILVFVEEDVDTKLTLYQLLDKQGKVCKFEVQKPLQIEKRLKLICRSISCQCRRQYFAIFDRMFRNQYAGFD